MGHLLHAEIRFEADAATVEEVKSVLAARGVKKLNFRTGELLRLSQVRPSVRTPFPEPDPEPRLYTLSIQSDQNLVETGRALAQAGVKAWINVASPQGPKAMELTEYLRQRGLL
jgi:hypothetical protein